ncbi:Glycine cleavage T protein (aminomethyl transferase) [Nitrosococcus oceani ATCC 19707]|uniref:Glycine cleavage T protein (Aminomethyl transferase) n=2 Tax=Nitrosococcus oceani TaxID=1229 RepID=Q3J8B9_NITOC|nr:folate-binding protein YgfZ [Nitrosococcus oceani]ABA58927.1 Glycine cleavage T protein (aminomethyl transferase) [Nitrosococcus oceani ATCC 19707]EDZ68210.1 Glycine cleavage T-protein (aminomethyl transferase) [Nitrosococcus oceani AFC27]KFI18727.1 glycine cleavage system protein T [Nitrosococcus oceani C-27]GEM18977.1 glycine cleavage system protein T [Nitrosococcus oceani]
MQQEWKSFLTQAGAVFDGEKVLHFGYPQDEWVAVNSATFITDLSHFGLIAISGEDASDFLQNLLTNDVKEVNSQRSQLTGLCNPKGRLLAIFRLFQWNANFYLSLPHSLLEAVLKRLNMYVLRAQVSLADVSDHFCRFGLVGSQASDELKRYLGKAPMTTNEVQQAPDCCILRVPGEPSRFEVVGGMNTLQKFWGELTKTVTPVGANFWELTTIRAGVATIYPETQASFIPQQVNLELREGVSFTKGCYPGQEVIARMHYRGKPSRRMFLAHISTDQQPQPGDPVYLANDEARQARGEIVAAQLAPEGGYDSLVVLQLSHLQKGDMMWNGGNGAKLTLRKLPYLLEY